MVFPTDKKDYNTVNLGLDDLYGSGEVPYIGPRALFDPDFTPPILYGRKKEERYLSGLISDSLEDDFPVVVSVFGIKGIGKTVLVNKSVLNVLPDFNTESGVSGNSFYVSFYDGTAPFLKIDCERKETSEIVFSILNELLGYTGKNMEINTASVIERGGGAMWSMIRMLLNKTANKPIFFLDNADYTDIRFLNKITSLLIQEKCRVITSFNTFKSSPVIADFTVSDFKLQLDIYTSTQLFKIGADRCKMAINKPVEDDLIRYIVDLISAFDRKIPGSEIRILRELYPLLKSEPSVRPEQVRSVCRHAFEGFIIDELGLAEYISDSDIVERLFLDNIGCYFGKSDRFYINYGDLVDFYRIAAESIDSDFRQSAFDSALYRLRCISLLLPSEFGVKTSGMLYGGDYSNGPGDGLGFIESIYPVHRQNSPKNPETEYFLTVPPAFLKEILDVAFGSI